MAVTLSERDRERVKDFPLIAVEVVIGISHDAICRLGDERVAKIQGELMEGLKLTAGHFVRVDVRELVSYINSQYEDQPEAWRRNRIDGDRETLSLKAEIHAHMVPIWVIE